MARKKSGRNDPCWCGSGEKYKRCHLRADEEEARSRRGDHDDDHDDVADDIYDEAYDPSYDDSVDETYDDSVDEIYDEGFDDAYADDFDAPGGIEDADLDGLSPDPLSNWKRAEIATLAEEYDAGRDPDPKLWLESDEQEKILWIVAHHRHTKPHPSPPNPHMHATIHQIVENQIALGDETAARATLQRLMLEGLTRHEAVHAIGMVLSERLWGIMNKQKPFDNDEYNAALHALTAEEWRRSGGGD